MKRLYRLLTPRRINKVMQLAGTEIELAEQLGGWMVEQGAAVEVKPPTPAPAPAAAPIADQPGAEPAPAPADWPDRNPPPLPISSACCGSGWKQ